MTAQPEPLSLLAFPLTGVLLGDVVTYDLPAEAQRHWDELLARYRQVTGSNGNLPYSALATALRAATGAHVNLYPRSKDKPPRTLIASAPLSEADVGDAIRVWEQAILGTERHAISFRYASNLADTISQVSPSITRLADGLTRPGGQPHAPDWMFDVASWHAAQRIAAQPWPIDGRQVRFRVDTNGDLLVWDSNLLWSHQWRNSPQPRYAAARLRLSMETLPWISDPVLAISPSVLRITNRLSTARNAWLEPNDPHAPLLDLRLTGRSGHKDVDYHARLILEVWTRLRGEQPLIPATVDLSGPPGRLRPVIPIGIRYPIGRGLGMHVMRELLVHTTEVLGMSPVTVNKVTGHQFHRRPQREGGRDPELLDPDTIDATIAASGTRRLRLVVLYRSSHTRRRIQNLLAHHFAAPTLANTQVPDDTETLLAGDAVSVVFCEARDLLAHGEHGQRRRLLSQVEALYPPDGTRAVALCETEYDKHDWAVRRFKARYDTTVQDPDKTDAKHVVNKLLADTGVTSQFLATKPADQSGRGALMSAEDIAAAVKDDHAGHAAIADLLRNAGLVHARLGDALAHGRQGISTPHAYVGLHIREQKKNGRRLSISLAALIPDSDQWAAWGYAWSPHPVTRKTGWMRYADAAVAYRASELIRGSRHTMWDEGVADMINIALDQLVGHLREIPYVLMVPGEGSRTIWPGLANRNLGLSADQAGRVHGKLQLPGPARKPPAAVVRVTPMPGGVRPVPGAASPKAPKTTNALYEHDQTGQDAVLVLATVPRQYDGSSGRRRVGSDHSRWTATPAEQPLTWYAHTCTEILVRGAAEGKAQQYGIATARLCDHAISWDGRTNSPAPLHLARQMDRDHPEYRRTIDLDEEEADVLDDEDLVEDGGAPEH